MQRLRAGSDTRASESQLGTLPIAAQAAAVKIFAAALAAVLVATAALYGPATTGPFQFDDYNVIVNNPAIHSLPAWLDSMPGIRPLLKLSYALNWSLLNGALTPQPFGFHLFNIGCHLLSTALVFSLLKRLQADYRHGSFIALASAALFAVHPAQTEAITYICGRSVALMSLFYLAAIVTWLHARRTASLVLFLCALLTRETAWTLPFALLLIDWARGESLGMAARRLWPHWLTLAVGMLLLIAIDDYRSLLAHSLSIRSVGENLQAQIAGQFYLLTQPLLGLHTNIDPAIAVDTPTLPLQAAVLFTLYALGFVLMWRSPRLRWISFALLWFFLHLLPTNSLLPRNDIANDRQLYLALIGPAWLAARGLTTALTPRIAVLTLSLITLLLAVSTWQRNREYRSEVALWQATAQHSPNKARPWNNLGYAYQQQGDIEAARSAYRHALKLDPDAVRARINLSLLDTLHSGQSGDQPEPHGNGVSDGTPVGK